MKKSGLRYNVIYIYGLDGSGKSTVCKRLVELFNKKGIRATYKWMRFNHYFSKPINAIARLIGLSYYKIYRDGTKIGYHCYYKSRFISIAYYISTFIDTVIASSIKIWLSQFINKRTLVIDRFVFDTIVDLAIDTKDPNLLSNHWGRLFSKLLPAYTVTIYLGINDDVVLRRRPDTKWDENSSFRKDLYEKINNIYGGYKVSNNGAIEVTAKKIVSLIGSQHIENDGKFRE